MEGFTSPKAPQDYDSVKAYLGRIKPRDAKLKWPSMMRAHFEGPPDDFGYSTDAGSVRFNKDGSVVVSGGIGLPKDDEPAALKAEFAANTIPQAIGINGNHWLQLHDMPDDVLQADEKDVFAFWQPWKESKNGKTFEAICVRSTRKNGEKRYLYYSYFNDGKWRQAEPEDFHRIYGLGEASMCEAATKLFLHEGQKATKVLWQRLESQELPDQWLELFRHSVHLGWCGGVRFTRDVDWQRVVKEARRLGVKEVVIVPDADRPGERVIREISKALADKGWTGTVRRIVWPRQMPPSWDFADDFPSELEEPTEGGSSTWLGPRVTGLLQDATWLTEQEEVDGGSLIYRPRDVLYENWHYLKGQSFYINKDEPRTYYNNTAFNKAVRPFSHVENTARLYDRHRVNAASLLAFDPAEPAGLIPTDEGVAFNRYKELRPPAAKTCVDGDVAVFYEFFNHLVPDEDHRRKLLNWVVTVLIHPGRRINHGVLITSEMQGTGKGLLGQMMTQFLGPPYVQTVKERDLVGGEFNEFLDGSILCVVPEIYQGHSKAAYNNVKELITEDTATINVKFGPKFKSTVVSKFYCCSNTKTALNLEENDRRWLVIDATEEVIPEELIKRFVAFFESPLSMGKLRRHLEDNWREKGASAHPGEWRFYVKPNDRAPMTSAKETLIEESRAPWETETIDLLAMLNDQEYVFIGDFYNGLKKDMGRYVPNSPREVSEAAKKAGFCFPPMVESGGKKQTKRMKHKGRQVTICAKNDAAIAHVIEQGINNTLHFLRKYEDLKLRRDTYADSGTDRDTIDFLERREMKQRQAKDDEKPM